jgi:hypothetical protein
MKIGLLDIGVVSFVFMRRRLAFFCRRAER